MNFSRIACWFGFHNPLPPRRKIKRGYGHRCRYFCSACGKQIEGELNDHDWGQEYKENTCKTVKFCRACGVKTTILLEHNFAQFVYLEDRNCIQISVCTLCGEKRTRTEHVYPDSAYDTQCSRCGFAPTSLYSEYSSYEDSSDYSWDGSHCINCGALSSGAAMCSNCRR